MAERIISFPGIFGSTLKLDFPNYFTVFGLDIYWYGVLITVGFLAGILYMCARSKEFGIKDDHVVDLLLFVIPCAIVGARLFYCIFEFKSYNDGTVLGTLGNMLRIRDGGLAIFGGVIAGILVIYFFCKKKKIPFGAMLDLSAFGLLIGQCIGRWGNFCNREAYGTSRHVNEFLLRMGLTSPTTGDAIYVHPCFLYESVWNLIGFLFLHFYSKKHRKFDGQIILMYFAWYGLGRFMIEGIRTDSLYIGSLRVNELLAFVLCAGALLTLTVVFHRKLYHPENMLVNRAAAQAEAEKAAAEEEKKETKD